MANAAERPHLQRFLEAVAAILGVDSGRRRLEVVFEDGKFVQWRVHVQRVLTAKHCR